MSASKSEKDISANYRDLFDHVTDSICILDIHGNFIDVNKSTLKLMGYSRKELLKIKITELVHPEDRLRSAEYFDKLQKYGYYTGYRGRLIAKGGVVKYIEVNSNAMYNTEGEIIGSRDLVRDISDYVRIQNALVKSEERFNLAMKGSTDGYWDWPDLNEDEEWWSDKLYEMLEYQPGEIKSGMKAFTDLVHPDDREIIRTVFNDHIVHQKPYDLEVRLQKKSGNYGWFRGRGEAILDENGKAVRMSGSLTDITDQKIADVALRDSEEKFRTIVTNSEAIIFMVDRRGIFTLSEGKGLAVLGLKPGEVVGQSVYDTYKDFPEIISSIRKGLNGEISKTIIEIEDLYFDTFYSPLESANGNISGVIGLSIDITDRIRNEAELQIAKLKAEESDRLKTAFLANISHEIRTPMNAIMGFSSLLTGEDLSSEQKKSYIDMINTKGNELLQLLSDLIDISKIESGNLGLNKEQFVLSTFILEQAELAKHDLILHNKEHIEILTEIPGDFGNLMIEADKSRLAQVFKNLVHNAIKFTSKGHIILGFELTEENYLELFICDTGIGIEEKMLRVIFERFRQVDDSLTREFGGTGLGLYISQSIIELLGGRIRVKSERGEGSSFHFTLPCKEIELIKAKEEEKEEQEKAEKEKAEKEKALKQEVRVEEAFPKKSMADKMILLVEDDMSNALYFQTLLKHHKARITHVTTGEDAVSFIKEQPAPDLILMDIRLPEMNGYETTRIIKEENTEVPIIAQTANAFDDDREMALEAGCVDYMSKPVRADKLVSMILNYI